MFAGRRRAARPVASGKVSIMQLGSGLLMQRRHLLPLARR